MIEGPWNASFREELRAFPFGRHDDQVDAASRAFMVLTSGRAPMRISDSVMRSLRLPVAPVRMKRALVKIMTPGTSRKASELLTAWRVQRQAKRLKTISADGDEELPEKAAYMSTSSFKAG